MQLLDAFGDGLECVYYANRRRGEPYRHRRNIIGDPHSAASQADRIEIDALQRCHPLVVIIGRDGVPSERIVRESKAQ